MKSPSEVTSGGPKTKQFTVHEGNLTQGEERMNRVLLWSAIATLVLVAIVGSKSALDAVDEDGSAAQAAQQLAAASSYWGEITATIDWCEPNYVVSPYVAEFVNTVTNLGFVALGFFGVYAHPNLELRFVLTFLSISLVGFGSAAFHATLKWNAQLGDEVPMFFLSLCFLYLTIENDHFPVKHPRLPYALVLLLSVFVYFYTVYRFATLFQMTWGILTTVTVFRMLLLTRKMAPKERLCFRIVTLVLLASAGLWALEQALCHSLPWISKFQLHGLFWHVGTAYAAYSAAAGCLYARLHQTLHQKDVCFDYLGGFIPIIRYDPFVNRFSVISH